MDVKYYTVRQASEILGLRVRTIREWIKLGRIKAVKLGGSNRWFISHDEIAHLVNGVNGKDA